METASDIRMIDHFGQSSMIRLVSSSYRCVLGIYFIFSARLAGMNLLYSYQFIIRAAFEVPVALAQVDIDMNLLLNGTHRCGDIF